MIDHFFKLPPLDHGGPEMKFTYLIGRIPWISQLKKIMPGDVNVNNTSWAAIKVKLK